MTLFELREMLEQNGAVYGRHFTFGGLGDGVPGIELRRGRYYTYRAERDGGFRKTDFRLQPSEDEACAVLERQAIDLAEADGTWTG